MNPFHGDTRNKIKVTTTVHPAFLEWLKDSEMSLAGWIEQQYEIGVDEKARDDTNKRLKFFANKTVELQNEVKALQFRCDMLEKEKYKEKTPDKPQKKNPMFKGNKHGGVIG